LKKDGSSLSEKYGNSSSKMLKRYKNKR